jgi:hypothetical protein
VLRSLVLVVVALLLPPAVARAELLLPPGFTAQVYVTGDGFEGTGGRTGRGFPSSSTLAMDPGGILYLARTGRRYLGGEVEDLWPVYRIPPGGATLTPATEARFFHGPPLPNPLIAGIGPAGEVLVTTYDRDRRIGVLYRVVDGRAELLAGGTPERNAPPLLQQPEGVAVDTAGRIYVADRARGVIVRLDASGRVLDPQWLTVRRPRLLGFGEHGQLFVGADGDAEAPWQQGRGEVWKVGADGVAAGVFRGPVPVGLAVAPSGQAFVADRHGGRIFALGADGRLIDLARFTDGDAPRAITFAPITPDTRRAGIAGDLLVVRIKGGAWPINEVIRISGPFEELTRRAAPEARGH